MTILEIHLQLKFKIGQVHEEQTLKEWAKAITHGYEFTRVKSWPLPSSTQETSTMHLALR